MVAVCCAGKDKAKAEMKAMGVPVTSKWFKNAVSLIKIDDSKCLSNISKSASMVRSRFEEGEDPDRAGADDGADDDNESDGRPLRGGVGGGNGSLIVHIEVERQPAGKNTCGSHCLQNLADVHGSLGDDVKANMTDENVTSLYLENKLGQFHPDISGRTVVLEAKRVLEVVETRAVFDDVFALFASVESPPAAVAA